MEVGTLDFALKGSFVMPDERDIDFAEEKPKELDDSQICQFIQNNVSSKYEISTLFDDVYEKHIETGKSYYLIPKKVIVVPKSEKLSVQEKVQLLKIMLSKVFSADEIYEISCGTFSPEKLGPWQKYVVSLSLKHFLKLMKSEKVYKTEEEKDKLAITAMRFFAPKDKSFEHQFTAFCAKFSSSNVSGIGQFRGDNFKIKDMEMKIDHADVTKDTIQINDSETFSHKQLHPLSKFIFKDITPTEAVVASLKSFDAPLNIEQARALSDVIAHSGESFIDDYFELLSEKIKAKEIGEYFTNIINVFAGSKAHMRLLKYLCSAELLRTGKSNEMFRQNNNSIRCALHYIKLVSGGYLETAFPKLCKVVADTPAWSYDNPTDADKEILKKLLDSFWTLLTETIDQIPGSVRSLFRTIRILSENSFRQADLNHRACFAIFLLRFLFVEMTDPQKISTSVGMKALAKLLQFTKMFAFAGQLTPIRGEQNGKRILLNPTMQSSFKLGEEFYAKLTEKTEIEEYKLTDEQLLHSVEAVREFILSNEEVILNVKKDKKAPFSFASEGISEFICSFN